MLYGTAEAVPFRSNCTGSDVAPKMTASVGCSQNDGTDVMLRTGCRVRAEV